MRHRILFICMLFLTGLPDAKSQQPAEGIGLPSGEEETQPVMSLQPHTVWYAPLWMHDGMFGTWDLHQGFNANVDLGVRIGWGKYNPWKGGSFFTNLNALYVQPLSKDKRWNAGIGGYYSNFKMWGDRKNTVGLMGIVDYQINDKMNAGIFMVHDFGMIGSSRLPFSPMPWLDNPSTTIGADWGIKINESVRFNVSMSYTRYHGDDYRMPVPPPHFPDNSDRSVLPNRTDR